jgi:ABC-type polysaccharide/polyol phosphate export permease
MPLSVHVFRAVLRHLINFAHNFLIVVFILLLFPPPASSAILLFIPGLLIVITMAVVCSTVLGILGARYRDFSYAVTMFMGPMFFLTPILWAPDVLSGARALVAAANPFTHFVALIREPLLGRAPEVFSYCYALGLLVAAALIALHLLGKHRNQVPYWIA